MGIRELTFYGLIAAAAIGALFLMSYCVLAMGMILFKITGIKLPLPRKPGIRTRQFLKWFHLVCVSSWFGSAVTLVAVSQITARAASTPCALDVVAAVIWDMDRWLIIPMAIFAIGSGLLLAFFSGYDLRYNWVIAKAVGGFWTLVMGLAFMTPEIEAVAGANFTVSLKNTDLTAIDIFPPVFYVVGAIQFSLLIGMLLLSVFKPRSRGLIEE